MEMWFSEFHTPDVKHSIRVNRQLYSRQSDYQRIDIFETPEFGRVLTIREWLHNNIFVFSQWFLSCLKACLHLCSWP